MSQAIPHWTPEMLDEYRQRLHAATTKKSLNETLFGLPDIQPATNRKVAQRDTFPPPKTPGRRRRKTAQTPPDTPRVPPRAQEGAKTAPDDLPADPHALTPYSPCERVAVPLRPQFGKQTKTEEKYNREVLGGLGRFEPVTLKLPGGGRYTPDFMTIDDGQVTFHEVKGSYRLGSQGRAFTAFHDAAAYYPMWRFVWAHWTGKKWETSTI